MIGWAIDARRQKYPGEEGYVYKPHVEMGETYRWGDEAKREIHDYNVGFLCLILGNFVLGGVLMIRCIFVFVFSFLIFRFEIDGSVL